MEQFDYIEDQKEEVPYDKDDGLCACGKNIEDCPEAYDHMTHGY
tara:strand:+ start:810 stop:941 length:132 start_codon:yes stop_codon:yes gene_type:complete